jgi:hypothetical protein
MDNRDGMETGRRGTAGMKGGWIPAMAANGMGWMPAVLLSTCLAAVPAAAAKPSPWTDHKLGLAVVSAGTWTTYGRLHGFDREDFDRGLERYEFNKLISVALYGKVLGLPAYLGLPLHWTAKRQSSGDVHRIAAGDLDLYVGKRIRRVEGRLGLVLPTGYRDFAWTEPEEKGRDGDPWIGSGNIQVTLALAANPNLTRYSRRWEASAEAKWALALDDGIAKSGSWGLYPSAKLSFRPNQEWKPGVEVSGHWKSQHWGKSVPLGDVFGRKADWGAGAVGTVFVERYVLPGLAAGAKAGHSLWGYHDAAAYHGSLYLLWFP